MFRRRGGRFLGIASDQTPTPLLSLLQRRGWLQ